MKLLNAIGRIVNRALIVVIWISLVLFLSKGFIEDWQYSVRGENITVTVIEKYSKDWNPYDTGKKYYVRVQCPPDTCASSAFEQSITYDFFVTLSKGQTLNAQYIPGRTPMARLTDLERTTFYSLIGIIVLVVLAILTVFARGRPGSKGLTRAE